MSETKPIADAPELSARQAGALRRVAALMIPANAALGVPGADDEAIFADIVASLGRDAEAVREALARLDAIGGGAFTELPADAQREAARRLRDEAPALATALADATVRCYYRDDRVMRSLGMEPRPPFPKGFDVDQGDWSLLDPVRARGRIWRDAG